MFYNENKVGHSISKSYQIKASLLLLPDLHLSRFSSKHDILATASPSWYVNCFLQALDSAPSFAAGCSSCFWIRFSSLTSLAGFRLRMVALRHCTSLSGWLASTPLQGQDCFDAFQDISIQDLHNWWMWYWPQSVMLSNETLKRLRWFSSVFVGSRSVRMKSLDRDFPPRPES